MAHADYITIEEWWPKLNEVLRSVLVSQLWSPLSEYVLAEIHRVGGPSTDDGYFKRADHEEHLPKDAVVWIVATDDFRRLKQPVREDPRAAYFRRSWPRR